MEMWQSNFPLEGREQCKGLRFTWVLSIHLDLQQQAEAFIEASAAPQLYDPHGPHPPPWSESLFAGKCLIFSGDAGEASLELQALRELGARQSAAELLGGEVVHDGVQAAVQTGQAERDGVAAQHSGAERTAGRLPACLRHVVERKGDMVGQEAEQEDAGTAQHHAQCPPLLAAVLGHTPAAALLPQASRRPPRARAHHSQRQQEA